MSSQSVKSRLQPDGLFLSLKQVSVGWSREKMTCKPEKWDLSQKWQQRETIVAFFSLLK